MANTTLSTKDKKEREALELLYMKKFSVEAVALRKEKEAFEAAERRYAGAKERYRYGIKGLRNELTEKRKQLAQLQWLRRNPD